MARIFKGVSIVIHGIVIGLVSYVQVLDPNEPPVPRTALAYEMPVEIRRDIPLPPAPRRMATTPSVNRNAAPIEPPSTIGREPESQPPASATPDGVPGGLGSGAPDALRNVGVIVDGPPPPPAAKKPEAPRLVGGEVHPPIKIVNVDPIYPSIAQAVRKEGVVILEVVIDAGGRVESVRVLRGVPMLDDAAVVAVRQWQFTPALLNGRPVPVVMTVTVNFQLK